MININAFWHHPELPQLVFLRGKVLMLCGDAGVADLHVPLLLLVLMFIIGV